MTTQVAGGIGIIHRVKDGKHHYEVDTFFKSKRSTPGSFVRRGDQLLKINAFKTQHLSPEMSAELLSNSSLMLASSQFLTKHSVLTVPHPEVNHPEEALMETGGFRPVFKKETVLPISMNPDQLAYCQEDEDLQVDDDDCDQDGTVLQVEIVGTTMAVVKGQGCAHNGPCKNCSSTACTLDDIVLLSKNIVEPCDFHKEKEQKDIAVQDVNQKFLNLNHVGNKACLKKRQENITIYYYESDEVDDTFKGIPVALNFTDTDKFLKCSRTGSDVSLSVMACRKDDLRFISKNNQEMLPFLFYMKGNPRSGCRLESASCEGWFVHAASTSVDATDQTQEEDSLYFFIRKISASVE